MDKETGRHPELKSKEILTLLDKIEWKDYFTFTFNGVGFCLIITPVDELEKTENSAEREKRFGKPAEYAESTYVVGFDIYLHDTIPQAERRRILFHEVLEASLRSQGLSESEAHAMALKEEERIFGKRNA